ncbi:unnamed protein product, partial [Meganyctiphanes norvegica]
MGKKKGKKRQKDKPSLLCVKDTLMSLDMEDGDRRKGAKHSSKARRKIKQQLKKERKMFIDMEKAASKANSGGWNSIKVSGGATMEKNFLLSSIGNYVETEFQPLGYHKIGTSCCFYLEGNGEAADAIEGLDKRLTGPDGEILKILVTKCDAPDLVLNTDQLQILKEVMARRYDTNTSLLDLSDFHHDTELVTKNILASLKSTAIIKQVLRIIRENVPDLKALNLSNNKLHTIHIKPLQALQNDKSLLAAINLENNNIGGTGVFKILKVFPLSELNVEFNPVVKEFKSPLKYIQTVRKELPNLNILDNVDIKSFLLENETPIIAPPKLDTTNDKSEKVPDSALTESMARTFLEQYYSLIDTENREGLIAAYIPEGRLEIDSHISTITSAIFEGHEKIKQALGLLPATQHQHSTFSFNLTMTSSSAVAIVQGQCLISGETGAVNFSRSMTIVPYNSGLCCSRDILQLKSMPS